LGAVIKRVKDTNLEKKQAPQQPAMVDEKTKAFQKLHRQFNRRDFNLLNLGVAREILKNRNNGTLDSKQVDTVIDDLKKPDLQTYTREAKYQKEGMSKYTRVAPTFLTAAPLSEFKRYTYQLFNTPLRSDVKEVMSVETKDGRNDIGIINTIVFHHKTIIPAGLQKVLLIISMDSDIATTGGYGTV
jgi:hypothetical protein